MVNTSIGLSPGISASKFHGIQPSGTSSARPSPLEVKSKPTEVHAEPAEKYQPLSGDALPSSSALEVPAQSIAPKAPEKAPVYESPAATILTGDAFHHGGDIERLLAQKSPAAESGAGDLGFLTADGVAKDLQLSQTIQQQIKAEMQMATFQRHQLMANFYKDTVRDSGQGKASHSSAVKNLLDL